MTTKGSFPIIELSFRNYLLHLILEVIRAKTSELKCLADGVTCESAQPDW